MVLLTITPAARDAINQYNALNLNTEKHHDTLSPESDAAIAHDRLIEIALSLNAQRKGVASPDNVNTPKIRLDDLVKGASLYKPPPKPKPPPTPEYVALMKRLREDEERRAYDRMINPPDPADSFADRMPSAAPAVPVREELDEVMYADINRQLALIANVLISIIACSVAIWIAARHWSTPQRLALSMTGSGLVAAAEIVIFSGYISRVKEAKLLAARATEKKEIVDTWVIDAKNDKKDEDGISLRYRKGKHR